MTSLGCVTLIVRVSCATLLLTAATDCWNALQISALRLPSSADIKLKEKNRGPRGTQRQVHREIGAGARHPHVPDGLEKL